MFPEIKVRTIERIPFLLLPNFTLSQTNSPGQKLMAVSKYLQGFPKLWHNDCIHFKNGKMVVLKEVKWSYCL